MRETLAKTVLELKSDLLQEDLFHSVNWAELHHDQIGVILEHRYLKLNREVLSRVLGLLAVHPEVVIFCVKVLLKQCRVQVQGLLLLCLQFVIPNQDNQDVENR